MISEFIRGSTYYLLVILSLEMDPLEFDKDYCVTRSESSQADLNRISQSISFIEAHKDFGTRNLSLGFANNNGEDQPVQWRSLISAFVIRFLESIISKLATSIFLIF